VADNQTTITLFSAPKPFRGTIGLAQERSIQSWLKLGPSCEIFLVGDEAGIGEAAQKYGVGHLPQVARTSSGTPILSSIFQAATAAGKGRLFCYINADIMLTSSFLTALDSIPFSQFLTVGRRWGLDPEHIPEVNEEDWEVALRSRVQQHGRLHDPACIDYFIHTRDLFASMPPFAVGRPMWDNWAIYSVRAKRLPVIDATGFIFVVHQNHDYSHYPGGVKGVWEGAEATRNRELAGGYRYAFTIEDADWLLTPSGLRRVRGRRHMRREILRLPALNPTIGVVTDIIITVCRPPVRLYRRTAKRVVVAAFRRGQRLWQ
jgi:hypothetical protein